MAAKKKVRVTESLFRLDVLTVKDNIEKRMRNATFQQVFDRCAESSHEELEDMKMIVRVSMNNVCFVTYHFHSVSLHKLRKQLSQYA